MNKLSKKWMKKLRKNPRKAQGGLRRGKGYCCLGIAARNVLKLKKYNLEGLGGIPTPMCQLLGLHHALGETIHKSPLKRNGQIIKAEGRKEITSLAQLNDVCDFDHRQHAEIIEENEKILFTKGEE